MKILDINYLNSLIADDKILIEYDQSLNLNNDRASMPKVTFTHLSNCMATNDLFIEYQI